MSSLEIGPDDPLVRLSEGFPASRPSLASTRERLGGLASRMAQVSLEERVRALEEKMERLLEALED